MTLVNIILCLIALVCVCTIIVYSYEIRRIDKVYKFRSFIIDLCYEYALKHKDLTSYERFHGKYTFDQMVYSFKPLTLEAWFSKEEIDDLMN